MARSSAGDRDRSFHEGGTLTGLAVPAPRVASRAPAGAPRRAVVAPDGLLGELAALAADDPGRAQVRGRIIEWYLPMAAYVARRFGGRGESLDDLAQVAAVGLMKAVDRFDPVRGVNFAGYAIPTIVGEIKRHFRDTTWMVRVPRYLQELKLQMPAATEELTHTLHREPTTAEVAQRLGISARDMVLAKLSANAYRRFSIAQEPAGRPALRVQDWLGGPDPGIEAVDNRLALRGLLADLSDRERQILEMRFEQDMSQTQIAAAVGLSQMHVSRLLLKSLTHLRKALLTDEHPSSGPAPRGQAPGGRRRSSAVPMPTGPAPAAANAA